MSKIFAYLLARAQERSTWLGITSALTGLGVALTPDQATTIISIGLGVAGLIASLTKDTLPPAVPAIMLAVALTTGLAACSTQSGQALLSVSCAVDRAVVPGLEGVGNAVTVVLAPETAAAVSALQPVEQAAHAGVQAACAAALPGGKPVAVMVATQ